MIIAVSGAQSTGKSTLLTELKKYYKVDTFQSARSVLSKMNKSLEEIKQSEDDIIEMQELIFSTKYDRDTELSQTNDLIFVERSFADLIAFSITWNTNSEKYNYWLKEQYLPKCIMAQKIYDRILFLPSGVFNHVDDGVRAKSDTQHEVSLLIRKYSKKHSKNFKIIKSSNLQDRVLEIKMRLTNYGSK